MMPHFYRLSAHCCPQFPVVHSTSAEGQLLLGDEDTGTDLCPGCGRAKIGCLSGPISAKVGDLPDHHAIDWPDAIWAGPYEPPVLLSERVVATLHQEEIRSFEAFPARIDPVSSPTLPQPPPKYFYLSVAGKIDIDHDASGLPGREFCQVCFRDAVSKFDPREPTKLVPDARSWDGSDLFEIRNYPIGVVFCTARIVLLARHHGWTNFKFQPMDTPTKYGFGWSGIDYLSETWPPPSWYPERPSAGRSADEWLQLLGSTDWSERYAATQALLDLGQSALPGLVRLLEGTKSRARVEAAFVLRGLATKGIHVANGIIGQVDAVLKDEPP